MKRQRGGLFQRTMAVLLSAVLTVSMVWNAASATALAQEAGGQPVIAGGDDVEAPGTGARETEPVIAGGDDVEAPGTGVRETEPESVSGNDAGMPGSVSGNDAEALGTGAGEPEPGTVSGNDAEPERVMMTEPAPQAGDIATGTDWVLDQNGKLTISSNAGMADWNESGRESNGLNVTSVVMQDGVTGIEASAFMDCSSLTSIAIPEGVTSIGNSAFMGCSSLTSIALPAGVTSIEEYAFFGCSGLTSIALPAGVTSIEKFAFMGCSGLTSIALPESVTSIGDGAFQDCSGLTSIVLPAGVTSIGGAAFSNCSGLTSIALPAGVTSIGGAAFSNCSGLTSIALPAGVTSIGAYVFWDCSSLTSIALPAGVTSIEEYAFWGCSGLTSIALPESVTSIGNGAFQDCSSLTSITIPAGVMNIGRYAFSGCSGLTDVTILCETPPSLGVSVFDNCAFVTGNTQGIHVPAGKEQTYKSATGWDSITNYITDIAAADTNIVSGNGWTLDQNGKLTISSNAGMADWSDNRDTLYNGTAYKLLVTGAEIQSGVTSIAVMAFYGCSNLAGIAIPGSVTSIGATAFADCSSLTSIAIPAGVKSIETNAFVRCSSLTSIALPAGVKSIGSFAFSGCSGLTSIELPAGVTSLGTSAFSNCSGLTSIALPAGVTSLGTSAFSNCSGLTGIELPAGMESIGGYAFSGCSGLTSIELPAGVTSLEKAVFSGCSGLTGIELPAGVTSIKDYAFSDCSGLTSIELPAGVESIGASAFSGCSGLTSIEIPAGVTSLEKEVFSGCSSLTSIEIPEGVMSIGNSAFSNCSGLTDVTIPENVISIGASAFFGCSGLTDVTMLSETPAAVGTDTFNGCAFVTDNEQGIHVPAGKANDYRAAWTAWADYITDHIHSWSTAWTTGETHHWHECVTSDCPKTDNADKSGYGEHVYDNDSDQDCNICGYTKTPPDREPPVGTIGIDDISWDDFQNAVAFDLFFGETKQAAITAEDEGSGVDQTFYYISDSVLTEADVRALEETDWMEGASFSIEPDRKCVIYARITDRAGNAAYLSSGGLVFDATAPVISGVTDGETYRTPQEITVTDALSGVDSVTVNGAAVVLNDNKFTLEMADDAQTVIVTDRAGNTASVTVSVKPEPHIHTLTLTPAKSATCTAEGNQAYYTCSGCDEWFSDREGSHKIADRDSVIIRATGHTYDSTWGYQNADGHAHICRTCGGHDTVLKHVPGAEATAETPQVCTTCGYVITPALGHTHDYGTEWRSDETGHYHECSCGDKKDTAAHTEDGGSVTTPPTEETEGVRTYRCTVCGYELRTETIPATGGGQPGTDSGKVDKEVQTDGRAPATQIATSMDDLKNILLTDEEKQQLADGTDIKLVLSVKDASDSVNSEDKAGVEAALNGFSAGQYLDISLYKLIGDNRTYMTETSEKITIVIAIPDSLKNTDSKKTREFAVIRVHNGLAELLADTDGSADTITIATDCFSTYAIVYRDASTGGDSGDDNDHGGSGGSGDDDDHGGSGSGGDGGDDDDHGGSGNGGNSGNSGNAGNGNSGSNSGNAGNGNNSNNADNSNTNKKDDEPATGDRTPLEWYATLAMISGFFYLLLYFGNRGHGGMTEETKKELIAGIIAWAKRGGKLRRYSALAVIFVLLAYYHSIGRKNCAEWDTLSEL